MDQITGTLLSCIRRHPSQDSQEDNMDDTSPNCHFHQRCVSDAVSFELGWSRSRNGVNAVGKCIVIDLYDNDTDARNYEEAFKGAGYETKYIHHPTVKVCSVLFYYLGSFKNVFPNLGWVHDALSFSQDMKNELRDKSLSSHSAITVVISSHGNEDGYLMDKEGTVRINTKEIFDALETNIGLVGKPKIVIIDACRNSKYELQPGIVVRIKNLDWPDKVPCSPNFHFLPLLL